MSDYPDTRHALIRLKGETWVTFISRQEREVEAIEGERDQMRRELIDAGWTHVEGAERWKSPVNHKMGELWNRLFETEAERDSLIATLEHVRNLSSKTYFTFPGYALAMKRIEELVGNINGPENG